MTDDVLTSLRAAADRTQPQSAFDLDEAMRRGRRRARRRNALQAVAGTAVVAALVAGVVTWTGGGSETDTGPASSEEHLRAAAEHLAVFESAQEPSDKLPVEVGVGLNLVDSTARAIAVPLESESYWAALDANGQVCVVALLEDAELDAWSAAVGCSPLDDFAERGAWVQLENTTGARLAWLLPDGWAFDGTGVTGMPRGYEWTLLAPNLASGEAS